MTSRESDFVFFVYSVFYNFVAFPTLGFQDSFLGRMQNLCRTACRRVFFGRPNAAQKMKARRNRTPRSTILIISEKRFRTTHTYIMEEIASPGGEQTSEEQTSGEQTARFLAVHTHVMWSPEKRETNYRTILVRN